MAEPLIPYLAAPELPLSFLQYVPLLGEQINPADPPSIKPFGTLVAIGVYVGSVVTMKRAAQRRIDSRVISDFIFWVVASGFVISHILDAIFYHWDQVVSDPIYLLKIWDGLSSYGGFIGAVMGTLAFRYVRKMKVLEMVDITVAGMPIAWVFGRAGCAVVHDHPGAMSNAWFAVKYPASQLAQGYGGRFDLGLYECLLTIPLAIGVHWAWRRKPFRPAGFYTGVILIAYAPVRFLLDFLRIGGALSMARGDNEVRLLVGADPIPGGLTPAQWVCFAALPVGAYFLYRAHQAGPVSEPADEDEEQAAGDAEEDEPDRAAEEPVERRKRRKKRRRQAAERGAEGAPGEPAKKKK